MKTLTSLPNLRIVISIADPEIPKRLCNTPFSVRSISPRASVTTGAAAAPLVLDTLQ